MIDAAIPHGIPLFRRVLLKLSGESFCRPGEGGISVDEAQNNFTADRTFVSHPATTVVGNEFDDIVTWVAVGNLVSRMVLGAQLP